MPLAPLPPLASDNDVVLDLQGERRKRAVAKQSLMVERERRKAAMQDSMNGLLSVLAPVSVAPADLEMVVIASWMHTTKSEASSPAIPNAKTRSLPSPSISPVASDALFEKTQRILFSTDRPSSGRRRAPCPRPASAGVTQQTEKPRFVRPASAGIRRQQPPSEETQETTLPGGSWCRMRSDPRSKFASQVMLNQTPRSMPLVACTLKAWFSR